LRTHFNTAAPPVIAIIENAAQAFFLIACPDMTTREIVARANSTHPLQDTFPTEIDYAVVFDLVDENSCPNKNLLLSTFNRFIERAGCATLFQHHNPARPGTSPTLTPLIRYPPAGSSRLCRTLSVLPPPLFTI